MSKVYVEVQLDLIKDKPKLNMRRIGRLRIPRDLYEEINILFKELLMSQILVFRCEMIYLQRVFELEVQCDEFEEIEEGERIPDYEVIIHKKEITQNRSFEYTLTFERKT